MISRRTLLRASSTIALALLPTSQLIARTKLFTGGHAPAPPAGILSSSPAKIGGGGFITGGDISDDNLTWLVRTDTYGAWLYNFATSKWENVTTPKSLAAGIVGVYYPAGNTWEMHVCKANPNRFYAWMAFDSTIGKQTPWISNDRGVTWNTCNPAQLSIDNADANNGAGVQRFIQQKIVADPYDPDVVFAGCVADSTLQKGCYYSTDTGATWTKHPDIPDATGSNAPGVCGIVFDKINGSVVGVGGKTVAKRMYIAVSGYGVYTSNDGGLSFSLMSGSPDRVFCCQVDTVVGGLYRGTLWCNHSTFNGSDYAATNTYRYDGSWTNVQFTPNSSEATRNVYSQWCSISKVNSGDVIFADVNGFFTCRTLDNGQNSSLGSSSFLNGGPTSYNANSYTFSCSTTDTIIPWLAIAQAPAASGLYCAYGMRFHGDVDRFYVLNGVGIWYADWPNPVMFGLPYINFYGITAGIEQLVIQNGAQPPGAANPTFVNLDRCVIQSTPSYAQTVFPVEFGQSSDICWAASDPSFMFANGAAGTGPPYTRYAYSTDYGVTWNLIPGNASIIQLAGGNVAAATPTDLLYVGSCAGVPSVYPVPQYSNDGGATWHNCVGLPPSVSGDLIWNGSNQSSSHRLISDPNAVGTYYAACVGHGMYKSTDYGANWSLYSASLSSGPNTDLWSGLIMSPDTAGLVLWTGDGSGLWRSTVGTPTLTAISGVTECAKCDFGGKASGAMDHRFWMLGQVAARGEGYYYTDNISAAVPTWVGPLPNIDGSTNFYFINETYAYVGCLTANRNNPNEFYIGTRQMGARKIALS